MFSVSSTSCATGLLLVCVLGRLLVLSDPIAVLDEIMWLRLGLSGSLQLVA